MAKAKARALAGLGQTAPEEGAACASRICSYGFLTTQDVVLSARCGSFQPGRTKWHVYPLGYFSR